MLEELGRPALPSLYRARDSDDPGLRRQVEQLIDLIERQRLLPATRVRLDFEDMSLPEVAGALGGRPASRWSSGRTTLSRRGESPCTRRGRSRSGRRSTAWGWPAVLDTTPGSPSRPPHVNRPSCWFPPTAPAAASDDGPFRVHLVRLARHRQVTPVRPPAEAKHHESLSADSRCSPSPASP